LTLNDGTRLPKNPKWRGEEVCMMLQEAAAADLHDYFEFLVGEAREELDGAPNGGSRYPVEARMDGREFALSRRHWYPGRNAGADGRGGGTGSRLAGSRRPSFR
jgi:hypothetical protein